MPKMPSTAILSLALAVSGLLAGPVKSAEAKTLELFCHYPARDDRWPLQGYPVTVDFAGSRMSVVMRGAGGEYIKSYMQNAPAQINGEEISATVWASYLNRNVTWALNRTTGVLRMQDLIGGGPGGSDYFGWRYSDECHPYSSEKKF